MLQRAFIQYCVVAASPQAQQWQYSSTHHGRTLAIDDGTKNQPQLIALQCLGVTNHTWCGRKVMRLAMLCTNRQCCCLPLHMAVRLTRAVDSVQV